ncbi:MAG: hypothetical protein B6D36_14060 [Planctomycetes bacterium UTPLA1]|nr:MAG: hypothetical protein B6D36_14060 [Planctomycetes bacterium UTPLA1]
MYPRSRGICLLKRTNSRKVFGNRLTVGQISPFLRCFANFDRASPQPDATERNPAPNARFTSFLAFAAE